MATITATSMQRTYRHPVGTGWRCFRHPLTVEPGAADEIDFYNVPKNLKILGAELFGTRIDTGGAPTNQVTLRLQDGVAADLDLVAACVGLRSATAKTRIAPHIEEPDAIGFVTDSDTWKLSIVYVAVSQVFAGGIIGCSLQYSQSEVQDGV